MENSHPNLPLEDSQREEEARAAEARVAEGINIVRIVELHERIKGLRAFLVEHNASEDQMATFEKVVAYAKNGIEKSAKSSLSIIEES